MSTAVYGAGDGSVVWSALNHTTAASFGMCRHLGPGVSQLFSAILGYFRRIWWRNGYPRRFWWVNGSETARPKYASLWTGGPILWAAAARTTAPSFGRFSAVPISTAGSYPPAPGAATSLYSWDDRIEVFLF